MQHNYDKLVERRRVTYATGVPDVNLSRVLVPNIFGRVSEYWLIDLEQCILITQFLLLKFLASERIALRHVDLVQVEITFAQN